MAYTKQSWTDNETLINAEHMNHIEDGIESAAEDVTKALETANAAQNTAEDAKSAAEDAKSTADSASTTADSALEKAEAVEESAITGVSVNGTAQPVNEHIAELTIEAGSGNVYYAPVTDSDFSRTSEINISIDGFKYERGTVLNLIFDCDSEHYADYININSDEGYGIKETFYIQSGLVTLVWDTAWHTTKLLQSAITAISVNGEDVPVENNKAEIEVSGSEPTYDADTETLIF